MSYFTIMPNIYNRPVINMPITHNYQPVQSPNLLQIVSLALKKSIQDYQIGYTQNYTLQMNKKPEKVEISLQKDIKVTQNVKIQDSNRKAQSFKIIEKNKGNNESIILKQHGKAVKHHQTSNQTITTDQSILMAPEAEQKKQKVINQKKEKKQKNRQKKRHFSVIVPEVNLIETAEIPQFQKDNKILYEKRENILKRRVQVWDEKAKLLRDKREIRMLNN